MDEKEQPEPEYVVFHVHPAKMRNETESFLNGLISGLWLALLLLMIFKE